MCDIWQIAQEPSVQQRVTYVARDFHDLEGTYDLVFDYTVGGSDDGFLYWG